MRFCELKVICTNRATLKTKKRGLELNIVTWHPTVGCAACYMEMHPKGLVQHPEPLPGCELPKELKL